MKYILLLLLLSTKQQIKETLMVALEMVIWIYETFDSILGIEDEFTVWSRVVGSVLIYM